MKIAILAAMDKEMALLENIVDNSREWEAEGLRCLSGRVGGHEVLLAKCGIGKVNAALNTYRVIRSFSPDLVINSGVAGGAGELGIGALLVADAVVYHDVWCGPGTEPGAPDGFDRFMLPSRRVIETARTHLTDPRPHFGLIATGDSFISKAEEIARIHAMFPDAAAVDMESAAIAQTCLCCGVEFAIIRVVSDTPGRGENISQYKDFWTKAPEATFRAVAQILHHL
ncbi:MAG: 5'-methylthioadenosine/adenosylhomocysteine nucleosidase [Muribaculaceae bacterium]|nr:5'-methylthioadenosine/adenosylhomocysteine nucleosidase [Muribaculaceae bacterium]